VPLNGSPRRDLHNLEDEAFDNKQINGLRYCDVNEVDQRDRPSGAAEPPSSTSVKSGLKDP
jgi:hypothetical protein